MAWVALDRAIKGVEQFGLEGPLDRWKKLRAEIASEIIARAFNAEKNSFVQYFGGKSLDAALLMMPLVGFLPANDPRIQGTVAAIEKELSFHGFIRRYTPNSEIDGLPGDARARTALLRSVRDAPDAATCGGVGGQADGWPWSAGTKVCRQTPTWGYELAAPSPMLR